MKLRSVVPLLLATLCISSTALAQSSLNQLVDHFLKVLPPDPPVDRSAVVQKELSRLTGLNPGHEAEIAPILSAYEECLRPAVDAATKRLLRSTAESMGAAKLAKLTEFYSGADYKTYVRLMAKSEAGKSLTATESATAARMDRTYPFAEFTKAFQDAQSGILKDQIFVQAATKCSLNKRTAFVQANLKF